MELTPNVVVFSLELLGDRLPFLWHDIFPGPLTPLARCSCGLGCRVAGIGLGSLGAGLGSGFVTSGLELLNLGCESKNLALFLGGCRPFASEPPGSVLGSRVLHEIGRGDVLTLLIIILFPPDEVQELGIIGNLVSTEQIDQQITGAFPPGSKTLDLGFDKEVE